MAMKVRLRNTVDFRSLLPSDRALVIQRRLRRNRLLDGFAEMGSQAVSKFAEHHFKEYLIVDV